MNAYFISLEPNKELVKLIKKQKGIIRNLVGEQKYLSHHPHITLIVSRFNDVKSLVKKLESESKSLRKLSLELAGLKVFYDDVQTNGHTISYEFSEIGTNELRNLQQNITSIVDEYNTKNNFEEIMKNFNEIETENYKKYGFPFIGKNWIPHITLGSIEKEKFDQVYQSILENKLSGMFEFSKLRVYKILKSNNKPVATFNLI